MNGVQVSVKGDRKTTMNKTSIKSTVMMVLAVALIAISTTSVAQAQGRRGCSNNGSVGRNSNSVYYGGQQYDPRYEARNDPRYDSRYESRYDPRYDSYRYDEWENQDTAGKAAKRVGIGAGIGAGVGAGVGAVLSRGSETGSAVTKGAIIGAGVGAATGYIIHRRKVNDQYDRYRRW